jgi:homoserine kinase
MKGRREVVTVRVPGSTSNCGAGFDTLGLALDIHNRVSVRLVPGGKARPERARDGRAQELAEAAASAFFRTARLEPCGFRYRIDGNVPSARGLGSSVTVIAGIAAGLNALLGAGLTRRRLVGVATEVEGHPDNASAGILGGFCVSRCDPVTGAYLETIRFAVPARLAFVVASPGLELLTKESRGALPRKLPYFDAVRSVNSAAFFTAAFAAGDFSLLRHAAGDFMHEPYRLPAIPGAAASIAAGVSAGAHTGWLSGSGSSVLCVCERADSRRVRAAMVRAFSGAGVASVGRILAADNRGLVVL